MRSLAALFMVTFAAYGLALSVVATALHGLNVMMFALAVVAVAAIGAVVAGQLLGKHVAEMLQVLKAMVENVENNRIVENPLPKRQDEIGQLAAAIGNMSNRDKASKQANEDPLTGLANRRYMTQKLDAIYKAGRPVSLLFIDLDGFKPINDTYGHETGDEALKAVAARFAACVRESDVLARLGGDEFVMLYNGLNDRDVLTARCKKVLELINEPIWINDKRLKMGASIGVAIGPEDGKTAEDLLAASDEAMYAAKQGGKNAFKFYS
ncbi:MAG: GGDEF domain-containing protein [Alphaproteobacteria bacterium]